MSILKKIIDQLEEHSNVHHKINPIISKASVGWHIEHSLKVINQIVDATEKSNPNDYKWKFNLTRSIILAINHIPRGKGKAPKTVLPDGEITTASLKLSIDFTRKSIDKLNGLNKNNFFKHPYFGDLNLKPTKTFLNLHTNHHLKIINDIIKAS